MEKPERWELVGGPRCGEVVWMPGGGMYPAYEIAGLPNEFAHLAKYGHPAIPPHYRKGRYEPEGHRDYNRRILRWKGWSSSAA